MMARLRSRDKQRAVADGCMGDALLAIFPLSEPSACADLLHAVSEARQAMAAVNEVRMKGEGGASRTGLRLVRRRAKAEA